MVFETQTTDYSVRTCRKLRALGACPCDASWRDEELGELGQKLGIKAKLVPVPRAETD